MSAARVFRLAHLVEPRPQTDCGSLAEASLAAFSLNLARQQLGLPALTHVIEYEDSRRVTVWPLDLAAPAGGATAVIAILTRAELARLRVILEGACHDATRRAALAQRRGDGASAERHRRWVQEVGRIYAKLEAAERAT